MASIQIPNLPVGGTVSADNLFEAVQTGTSVRVTAEQIATYVQSSVFGSLISVPQGGTGAASLTGYVFGTGTSPLTGVPLIPLADISGAGTAASKNLAVGATAPSSPAVGDLWVDTN
jgi:hypothetical protein